MFICYDTTMKASKQMEDAYPTDAILVEEHDGVRTYIPRLVTKLTRTQEGYVQEAMRNLERGISKRRRQRSDALGQAAAQTVSSRELSPQRSRVSP
jgi:hypothetical protein